MSVVSIATSTAVTPAGAAVAPTSAAAAEMARASSTSASVIPPVAWVVSTTWTSPG